MMASKMSLRSSGGLAFVGVEDERVCAGVERECDVFEDVEGWGAGAGLSSCLIL